MRLSTGLLLPAFISAASAISDATVYIFQGDEFPNTLTPPTLTPEEARLVFAQRLGVSEYHGLGDTSEATLSYINKFGGPQETLFHQGSVRDKAAELVLVVEGISSKTAEPLLSAWSSIKPAFTISNPPSSSSNRRLAKELQTQIGEDSNCPFEWTINPFDKECWNGKPKIVRYDLVSEGRSEGMDRIDINDLMSAQKRLIEFAKNNEMNVVVVLMPEACRTIKSSPSPYGTYDMPQAQLGRRQAEAIMTEEAAASSSSPSTQSKQFSANDETEEPEPLLPVPAWCYKSVKECNSGTNSCSGHGSCKQKTAKEGERPACFACDCGFGDMDYFNISNDPNRPAKRAIYWSGAACQKKDISGPFWLFAGFTVVIFGLISWAIGMLFSIGEEKLPGVIGAGVSSKVR